MPEWSKLLILNVIAIVGLAIWINGMRNSNPKQKVNGLILLLVVAFASLFL